ncbi:MAG: LysM peptidoglycan-binding domain-containing protein [Phycisphaerae bacterium]|nr:LysM peptidoglycan-binding domain-containing protein [Phycisphaerae bacterium]
MTRETRIGLLVGLGFIITFGLVLTELTGSGRPGTEPASLNDSAELALAPAEDISPAVVHAQDLPPRVGAPAAALMAAGQDAPAQAGTPAEPPAAEVVAVVHSGGDTPSPAAGGPAALIAQGSPRITIAAELEAPPPAAVPVVSPAPAAAATPARTYVVQPGDSLVKIARKVYGDDPRDGYKRILEANCDRITDPSLIRVGQVLVIPAPMGAVRAVAAGSPNVQEVELGQLADVLASAAGDSPQQPGPRTVYVIQRGDTLTKIARETLNDGSRAAVMSIFSANQSKLSDPDRLPVGAELVIPG